MAKFEETTISNGAQNVGDNTPKKNNGNATWKSVTIGGLTGIFFGVASSVGSNIYAATKRGEEKAAEKLEAKASEDELNAVEVKATPKPKATVHTEEEKVEKPEKEELLAETTPTDEEKSFEDGFNEAREALGPGKLFVWDGKVCTTYTEEEWNNLTDEERQEFALNAQSFTDDGDQDQVIDVAVERTEPMMASADDGNDDVKEVEETTVNTNESQTQDPSSDQLDDDVQILGVKTVTLPNGEVVDMAHVRHYNEDVAIIDFDQDGIGDVAMADLNHNGIPDEGEIVDLHTKQVISVGRANAHEEDIQPETDPSVSVEADYGNGADDSFITDDGGDIDTSLI